MRRLNPKYLKEIRGKAQGMPWKPCSGSHATVNSGQHGGGGATMTFNLFGIWFTPCGMDREFAERLR